jgi:hypothetical protein
VRYVDGGLQGYGVWERLAIINAVWIILIKRVQSTVSWVWEVWVAEDDR